MYHWNMKAGGLKEYESVNGVISLTEGFDLEFPPKVLKIYESDLFIAAGVNERP